MLVSACYFGDGLYSVSSSYYSLFFVLYNYIHMPLSNCILHHKTKGIKMRMRTQIIKARQTVGGVGMIYADHSHE